MKKGTSKSAKRQSKGAAIAKVAIGVIFIFTGFGMETAPEVLAGMIIGLGLIAWGIYPYIKARKEKPNVNDIMTTSLREQEHIESLPAQAPDTLYGHRLKYHYKDVNIVVAWQYCGQYGQTCASIGVKRGDTLSLVAEPYKNYEHDKLDASNVSVYWGNVRLGVMKDNRLRNMVHQWQEADLPIFCAVTDTGEVNRLYVEFGFYGTPSKKHQLENDSCR